MLTFTKAHAYGNDFLYVPWEQASCDLPALARRMCSRHRGVGADGLIVYRVTERGAAMRLTNADGSPSEVSGNGVRGLAALLARLDADTGTFVVETDAGEKHLTVIEGSMPQWTFRAAMGHPENLRRLTLEVLGHPLDVIALSIGNPQCVVLEPTLDERRLHALGPILTRHEAFPEGTNVELAQVTAPDRVEILIWERGVGPTEASGTGACAAAVAAAAFGGAHRDVAVVSPGGTQRVEWTDDGVYLTGWAEILFDGTWLD